MHALLPGGFPEAVVLGTESLYRSAGQTDLLLDLPSTPPLVLATLPTIPEDGRECLVYVEL